MIGRQPFVPFELERWQSTWEHRVRYNLSESGVHPLSIRELLGLAGEKPDALLDIPMGYGQSDGSDELRNEIVALYPGATTEQIVVTIGSAEANFLACWTLIEPGDRVVVIAPTYMQIPGLARNLGAKVVTVPLLFERGWEPDPDAVRKAISPGTRLVIVTNPNNPTGRILSSEMRTAVLERVRAVGAWLLVDEVYQGAELDGRTTPSFFGSYDRLLVVNGLSKAYGLPGLRIGWIAGPGSFRDAVVQRHDYTVIGASPAMDFLATRALRVRKKILDRTRRILNTNLPVLEDWLRRLDGLFEWRPPDCGAICLVRYRNGPDTLDLVEQVRARHDILLVPGEHFELPRHLRLGYGNENGQLEAALADLEKAFRELLG